MNILTHRILPASLLFALSTLPAMAQRSKVSYYSRSSSVVVEAYVADAVDVQPEFPGGDNAMMRYINKERRYPRQAYQEGIEGRVLCGFVVMPNGSISDIEIIRGVEESIDREAVRIIRSMPAWKAGRVSGSPVPVYCILPIAFRR
ncbi:MAG: energy transducer TonB [Firmicutes bacterium]|nr:energy transducer TonB [Bacillota bacterium]MCM1401109.1 energy transducer TonB [Bacteroides sp.]MCM1477068.1 energy transducer TonB [Bacteroides sp.]